MKNSNTTQVKVTEGASNSSSHNESRENRKLLLENLKKPLIYFLMAVVCAGSLYLIFKPEEKVVTDDVGFNSVVPQAADDHLQSDKQKAYEQQLLENKNEEKRNALTTLSDYWTDPVTSTDGSKESVHAQSATDPNRNILQGDPNAVNSYRNAQQVIHETKTISSESMVTLRLLQPMMLSKMLIPAGTLVKASGKFQGGRLQLKISTIEYKGNIQNVEINIHDNDGQPGLTIPYSPEQNAANEILGNMGQTSGTNIMMTQSAGQQIAADLTKGVVQGVSGYFQKKVRLPKVTVKAGHQVFLVSKK